MGTSYQDIDTRLRIVEDKLDLVMKVASVTKREPSTLMPGEFITSNISLLDLYREIKRQGLDVKDAIDGDQ
jgi:hypothetical protein